MLYKSFVWLRFLRRKTYPWIISAIAAYKLVYLYGNEQEREKVRLRIALTKIDFVAIHAFMNDLLW